MHKHSVLRNLPIKKRSGYLLFCSVLILLIMGALIISALVGSVNIRPDWIGKIIVNKTMGRDVFAKVWKDTDESIIWTIRIPRVILAFLVGAGLSLCGILMQALTKNSLADPYVLGISSGASAGAVFVIMYGAFSFAGSYHIMVGATIGAVLSIMLAMKVSAVNNRITSTQLVLAGIAVSALFTAFTNLMIYYKQTGSDKVKTALYWMMGSLSGATWDRMFYIASVCAVCTVLIYLFSGSLDVLLLGDDAAVTLGVNIRRIKLCIIILCTVLTGAIVSVSGVIGFVGLVIPHITRSFVGSKHSRLIPASVLLGGLFLILCDAVSRVVVSPSELPLGVVTSFFGAPFFLALIRKNGNTFRGRN